MTDEHFLDERAAVLAPPQKRDAFYHETKDLNEVETLQRLFRNYTRHPGADFQWTTKQLRTWLDEYGLSAVKETVFYRQREPQDDGSVSLNHSDTGVSEYIRKSLVVEHVNQLKDTEKLKERDYLDMEICAQAAIAADVFVGEEKWVGLIEKVCGEIEGFEAPIVVPTLDDFFAKLESA